MSTGDLPGHFHFRIAYADTDSGGVVYHSKYLDIFERARFELFEAKELSLPVLQSEGCVFVVRNLEMDFLKPARLGDVVIVETRVSSMKGARMGLEQVMLLEDGQEICRAKLSVVSLRSRDFKPQRIPSTVQKALLP